MAEKKYLNYEGLQDVAGHVNTRLKTVTSIPVSADNGAIRLYVGTTTDTYIRGHIYQYNSTDSEWVDITSLGQYIQYSTMPTASADIVNKIVQYTGTTNQNYTNGYFYKCVLSGSNYIWTNINVQAGGSGSDNIVNGYFNPTDNLFYEESTYTTPITGASNVLYISLDTDFSYRYNGLIFVRVDNEIDDTTTSSSKTWSSNKISSTNADISAIATNETGTTASKAYAVGEHFYKNGKFCTAKATIAQGAQFTLNTNYVEGTVADNLGKKVLLWTNPTWDNTTPLGNSNYTFNEQYISDVKNNIGYDYYIISLKYNCNRQVGCNIIIQPNNTYKYAGTALQEGIVGVSFMVYNGSNFVNAYRDYYFDPDTNELKVNSAQVITNGSGSTDNHYLFPYKIYGVKL